MERRFPRTEFKSDLADLMHALFSLSVSEIAEVCGVGITTAEAWRAGREPVPYMAYQLLLFRALGRVPFGPWAGWRFIEDRICAPGMTPAAAPRQIELEFIDHYRIDRRLTEQQAELLDGTLRQRDFYKQQCGLEARWGLMLTNLFT
ncbi:hypothetical protein [Chitinolyticbacter albus]|uniref:hypothetical protein n=1 Tax=Chitinolyticbacter albus TaxID=2961951 RepID=UPI00210C1363|nr:hypothetical protein [Chitinolyticbacter albus]